MFKPSEHPSENLQEEIDAILGSDDFVSGKTAQGLCTISKTPFGYRLSLQNKPNEAILIDLDGKIGREYLSSAINAEEHPVEMNTISTSEITVVEKLLVSFQKIPKALDSLSIILGSNQSVSGNTDQGFCTISKTPFGYRLTLQNKPNEAMIIDSNGKIGREFSSSAENPVEMNVMSTDEISEVEKLLASFQAVDTAT